MVSPNFIYPDTWMAFFGAVALISFVVAMYSLEESERFHRQSIYLRPYMFFGLSMVAWFEDMEYAQYAPDPIPTLLFFILASLLCVIMFIATMFGGTAASLKQQYEESRSRR